MGIGIASLVQQDPKQWDADFFMDDAQHQDIDMAAAKLPACTIQRLMPWLSRQPHNVDNQSGDTGFVKMDMFKKALKATVDG